MQGTISLYKTGVTLSIVGVISVVTGLGLWSAGVSIVPEVPVIAPFLGFSRFAFLAGGLFIIFNQSQADDEYTRQLRWKSFKVALIFVALLVSLNQIAYFFTNPLNISAIDMIIIQVWIQMLVFGRLLKKAGA